MPPGLPRPYPDDVRHGIADRRGIVSAVPFPVEGSPADREDRQGHALPASASLFDDRPAPLGSLSSPSADFVANWSPEQPRLVPADEVVVDAVAAFEADCS